MTPASAFPRPRVLLSASRVQSRIRVLARRIDRDYAGREVVFVGVLKGAFVFMADLARRVKTPVRCDFICASSYGHARRSSGAVRVAFDLTHPIAGEHVLLIEDIVDTGLTARRLAAFLRAKRPASLRLCALLVKRRERGAGASPRRARAASGPAAVHPDYVGFRVPDRFVVGYGLDLAGRYRNLPYVGVV